MNLEELIPGLAECRLRERRNRVLAFSGLTHTVCGRQLQPFRPIDRLRLELIANAFVTSRPAITGRDVFQVLRVLDPKYIPGRRQRLRQWLLRRYVRRLSLRAAAVEITAYLAAQLQDSPEDSGGGSTELGNYISWVASESTFWLHVHGGFTLGAYLETPYLVLQQLRRAWKCHHPEVTCNKDGTVTVHEPAFINFSDRIVGAWHRSFADAVAERIKSQHERRN